MDTILVFSTSIGRANADMLAGVREFAKDAEWNVQSFLYDGEPFPVRKLLDFWTPAGCIVESCGNGVSAGIIDQKAFRRTPVGSSARRERDGATGASPRSRRRWN